jgi:hypothetical protein
MRRHAGEGEFGGRGGGNMLRRGESSWLCMKFEFAFFVGHGILIRVLSPSRLALTVNELCLLFWPITLMRLHAVCCTFFKNEISL